MEVDPNPNPNPNPHPNPTIQPTRLIDRIRGGGCGGSSVKVSVYSTLLSTLLTYATPPIKSLASSVVSGLASMVKLDSGASEHILGHSLISEATLANLSQPYTLFTAGDTPMQVKQLGDVTLPNSLKVEGGWCCP